jgi:hypothetical protein
VVESRFDVGNPYGPFPIAFPTPYQLPYFAFTGSPEVVDPNTGNALETWATFVAQPVQGWDIFDSAKLPAAEREIEYSMYLMVPPDFWPNIRDRFGVPTVNNELQPPTTMFAADGFTLNTGIFEVTGHDIETYGFANWAPGNVILLKELA